MAPSPGRIYIIEGAKISLNLLQDISSALPAPVQVVIHLVKRIVVAAEAVTSNRDLCNELRDRLLRIILVTVMLVKKSADVSSDPPTLPLDLQQSIGQLENKLESILKEVEKVHSVTASKRKRHKVAAFFLVQSHSIVLKKCSDDLEWAMREFDVSSRLTDAVRLCEVSRKVYELSQIATKMTQNTEASLSNQVLQSLPRAKYATFDCERPDRPSRCFEGTRTHLLETILEWIVDPNSEIPRFFWMKGLAGVGKTTVARTIAELAQDQGLLGGQFFFSRKGEAELRNPALVFPTVAYQLARFDPEFRRRITEAIETDPDAPYTGLKQQLDKLIVKPLSGLERDPKRVVVIIFDAFDECDARGAKEILQLLVAAIPSMPFFLKILVTGRPEPHIQSVLIPSTNIRMTALHDIEDSVVKGDVRLYLEAQLRSLPAERGLDLPFDWIAADEIDLLAEKAGTLFIHAATSLRFLWESLDLLAQLEILLRILKSRHDHSLADNPYVYLDDLYLEILRGLVTRANAAEVIRTLQPVLGSIILLRDPLPVDALERLVGLRNGGASRVLPLLYSVILPPSATDPCPRVYHPSFPDFLQDANRCQDPTFRIDTEKHEARMALRCLELLNRELHVGMLRSSDPSLLNNEVSNLDIKLREVFSPELQYACRYWASHLVQVSQEDGAVLETLESFSEKSLLAWMEVMSWLDEAPLCLTSLESIVSWLAQIASSSMAQSLLKEGHRLLLAHFTTISQGAQHIARSVLPFLPRNSALLSQYKQFTDPTVTLLWGGDLDWPTCLMVLTSHTSYVYSVVFSPDGSRLASGSSDKTVRIWDASTGTCLATLEGHSDMVRSVGFSLQGSRIASGSSDKTMRIWDATTGVCLTILEGHHRSVSSVAFAPDGTRLASGSEDTTIRVWDIVIPTCVFLLEGHTDHIFSVAYSSCGTHLASGSADNTVRLWDAIDGKPLKALEGHNGAVLEVVFSPTDSRLASGSRDNMIRIWDVATGTCVTVLEGHTDLVGSLSYTSDGLRLASGSYDKTIRIWDPTNSTSLTTFRGHSYHVTSVAYSPNSRRLASASRDNTVRIWEGSFDAYLPGREGHLGRVTSLSFTSDGKQLASGSGDRTVRVWDAVTGDCASIVQGSFDSVECVAFSPDGLRIACASNNCGIRVWDSTSGDCSSTLLESSDSATRVAFSPDGTRLACGTSQKTLRVWDIIQGDTLAVFESHQVNGITSLTYSPDGSCLVSGAYDKSIRVWDPVHGVCLATLHGNTSRVDWVAYSPTGTIIASKSWNGDIFVWSALTYARIDQTEARCSDEAEDVAGNLLHIVGEKLVRIDHSGRIRLVCKIPPTLLVRAVDFVELSPGKYRVAIGCLNGSIVVLEVLL